MPRPGWGAFALTRETLGLWKARRKGGQFVISRCEPVLREVVGAWLASTPPDHAYRIGVTGQTPEEARTKFTDALDAWEELHARAAAQEASRA